MHRSFFRFLAGVLVMVLGVGLPAVAGAQSANGKKPDSSYSRQLQANAGRVETLGSDKLLPDQPPNSFIQYGEVWGCNDGFTKSGNKCVSIFSKFGGQPANSFVQYRTIWGCTAGFTKERNKCVSVFTKKRVVLRKKNKDG